MSERRSYPTLLTINGRSISEVIIDPHYETRHPDISDALILELVAGLGGKEFQPDERNGEWEFYSLDRIEHQDKLYRLVWCLRDECLFIGVINCFRR